MTHTLSACSFGRSLEGGEICHRHRRHPQDRQDEVQPRLVPFRCRVECCCWAVEQDRGRWRGGIGWMDGIRCGCGVYRQFSCANMSSYAQTSPPPGASRARRTSLRLPLFAAKSCRLRLRRSSAASTTYVSPTSLLCPQIMIGLTVPQSLSLDPFTTCSQGRRGPDCSGQVQGSGGQGDSGVP